MSAKLQLTQILRGEVMRPIFLSEVFLQSKEESRKLPEKREPKKNKDSYSWERSEKNLGWMIPVIL